MLKLLRLWVGEIARFNMERLRNDPEPAEIYTPGSERRRYEMYRLSRTPSHWPMMRRAQKARNRIVFAV